MMQIYCNQNFTVDVIGVTDVKATVFGLPHFLPMCKMLSNNFIFSRCPDQEDERCYDQR